jgi:hypothetical protein
VAIDLSSPRPANERGWGSGWPHCQSETWVPLKVDKVDFPSGIRPEVHDLAEMLLNESERLGYITLHDGWCWGAACRPIKTSNGGYTNVASNHSWGLALDLNAPENPFGGTQHDIPVAMARLWNRYGWRWGGDYSGTKDWMHFEFCGTAQDAARLTEQARKELDDVALTDKQAEALEFAIGVQQYAEKGPEPQPGPRLRGYRWATRATEGK